MREWALIERFVVFRRVAGTKKVTTKSETVKSTVSKDDKRTTVDTKQIDVTSKKTGVVKVKRGK